MHFTYETKCHLGAVAPKYLDIFQWNIPGQPKPAGCYFSINNNLLIIPFQCRDMKHTETVAFFIYFFILLFLNLELFSFCQHWCKSDPNPVELKQIKIYSIAIHFMEAVFLWKWKSCIKLSNVFPQKMWKACIHLFCVRCSYFFLNTPEFKNSSLKEIHFFKNIFKWTPFFTSNAGLSSPFSRVNLEMTYKLGIISL